MTNRIAIGLGLLIVLLLAYDAVRQDWAATVFLGRKGMDFIEWLAFWR